MKDKFFVPPKGEHENHRYHTKLEARLAQVITPLEKFAHNQLVPGILLLLSTICALIWANNPAHSETYFHIVNASFGFSINNKLLAWPVKFWVNDVFMAIFFFFVGLQIKREFIVGDLLDSKKAMLVVATALGGVVLPAAIYFICNINTPEVLHGWGIPITTDTAFALGLLACFKKFFPTALFNFLATISIIDDIIAILIIALFYTQQFHSIDLFYAFICFLSIVMINALGFRQLGLYLLIGLIMGYFIEHAGIHSTLTGILVAFALPARPAKGPNHAVRNVISLILRFEKRKIENPHVLADQKQHEILKDVKNTVEQATTPLQHWQHLLEKPISYFILPCFAFINAGINFSSMPQLFYPVSLVCGIILGLAVAKPIGFFVSANVTSKLLKITLPEGMNRFYLAVAAILSGIGFTMSLLIAELSFEGEVYINTAKLSIMCASLLMIVSGVILLLIHQFKFRNLHSYHSSH